MANVRARGGFARTAWWVCLVELAACASAPPPGDAMVDVAEAGQATDGSDGASTPDARSCEDLSGAYEWTGNCLFMGVVEEPLTCITQTGCEALSVAYSLRTTGTVEGNVLTTRFTDGFATQTCTITVSDGTATQHCVSTNPSGTCDATGVRATFPGATSYCCTPGAASCGPGERCQPLGSTASTAAYTGCVPAGATAEGGACTRAMNGRIGADECGAGLTCVNYGAASAAGRTCQRLCRDAGDCQRGEVCTALTNNVVQVGICRPTCTLFGSECGSGQECRALLGWEVMHNVLDPSTLVTHCSAVGSASPGTACHFSGECGPLSDCVGASADTLFCRSLCDATHPCPSGTLCTVSDNIGPNPMNAAFCLPHTP